MVNNDPRIDEYIEKAKPFAKPILIHIRALMHQAVPDMKETIKWGAPNFDYKGMVCMLAAFKEHVGLAFRKDKLMNDPYGLFSEKDQAIGSLGKIKSLADLPEDKILIQYIREAAKLNEEGVKAAVKKNDYSELKIPAYFMAVLHDNSTARAAFDKMSPSSKNEYIQWFEEAKTEPTRLKRISTAIEWISEGKSRNWKYKK